MGSNRITEDPRIDPRIKAVFGAGDMPFDFGDVDSREQLLEEANSEDAVAQREMFTALGESCDTEELAPSDGLTVTEHRSSRNPTATRSTSASSAPTAATCCPCVYYIHGGGMAEACPATTATTGRGAGSSPPKGVAVAMVDFRNALVPSSAEEVAPYPAGLNDCVSGSSGSPPTTPSSASTPLAIVVAGESGGGNLTLATGLRLKRDGDLGLIQGLYALCPYIAGMWPSPDSPSSVENNGILLDLHNNRGAMGYGIEELEQPQPARLAGLRHRGRRPRPGADHDQRQRVRPAAGRGHQLLPPAGAGRRRRPLPPGHGHRSTAPRSSR